MIEHVQIGPAVLYHGDCLEVLPDLGRVDAVITDPPFDAEAHAAGRRVLTRGRDLGRSRSVDPAPLPFDPLTAQARDTLAAWAARSCSGWFLSFCQAEAVERWRVALTANGAKWVRAMVWVKPDSAPQISGDRPAQGYESIATAWCGGGRMSWNGGGKRGVFTHTKHDPGRGHGGASNDHPTQKPIALMSELVHLFSNEGQTVADPFMGSGTTGVACVQLGRAFIGIERERRYFDLACERVDAALSQARLFA